MMPVVEQVKELLNGQVPVYQYDIDQHQDWAAEAQVESIPTFIICDNAGRLQNKKGLMDELAKIGRIIEREAGNSSVETLLVLDATTGQNALNQAREFGNACGISGIVLTKLDGTARGGVVVGIRQELKIPIKFIGVGEQAEDLQPFDPDAFAKSLFE